MTEPWQHDPENEAFVTCVLNDWRSGLDTLAIAEKWFPPRPGDAGNERARRSEPRICRIVAGRSNARPASRQLPHSEIRSSL